MTRFPYATPAQFAELMRRSGLPERTPPANAFQMLAHAPAIGAPVLRVVFALLAETCLDPKLRELVILRVAQRCGGRYASVQHVPIARQVGVADIRIAAIERGETPAALFNERELAAFALADEVVDNCRAPDETFAAVCELFSSREVLELLLLIGYFRMICGLMTTLEVEVESPFGVKILNQVRDVARGEDRGHTD